MTQGAKHEKETCTLKQQDGETEASGNADGSVRPLSQPHDTEKSSQKKRAEKNLWVGSESMVTVGN